MKTATELLHLAEKSAPKIVNNVFWGVREHIIKRCEQEALIGKTYYDIYLKPAPVFCQTLMFEKCMEIAKEFEQNGYFVSIDHYEEYSERLNFVITISWGGKVKQFVSMTYHVVNDYHTK